jgi:hypothetical protein
MADFFRNFGAIFVLGNVREVVSSQRIDAFIQSTPLGRIGSGAEVPTSHCSYFPNSRESSQGKHFSFLTAE